MAQSAVETGLVRCSELNRILHSTIDLLLERLRPVLADRPIGIAGVEADRPADAGPVVLALATLGDGIGSAEARIRSLFDALQC